MRRRDKMNPCWSRRWVLSFFLGGLAVLVPAVFSGSELLGGQETEEISGRELRIEIEKKVQKYIERLEKERGAKFTEIEKNKMINRIWVAAKNTLEEGMAYAVIDP